MNVKGTKIDVYLDTGIWKNVEDTKMPRDYLNHVNEAVSVADIQNNLFSLHD